MSELQIQNITEADVVLGKIANGLQSAASDHILGIAKDIYDTKQQAYQEDINEYLLNKIDGYTGGGNCECDDKFLDAVLERDVKAELSVGGILEGTTLTKGMTFTTFVERLLTLINVGSIKSPTGEGTVSIEAPTIIVEKEENGSWVEIKSGATVKENTKVRVRITNIPESTFEKIFAGIKKGGNNPGDVLAYGWLKSVDGGDAVFGEGNCEISTNTDVIGKDHLTISIANGDFNGLEIDDDGKINNVEFTIRASSSTPEIKVGEIKVQSNSAKYQLKSAYDYEIAAASNKQVSKPEQLENISTDRKITINKDANIGSEKSSSNYSTFILNVEGWGLVPKELKTPGTVTINKPIITVYNVTEGEPIVFSDNETVELNPNDTIKVDVKLDEEPSSVKNSSAYLEKTSSTFQYGWEKLKNNKSEGKVLNPTGNCAIGTTWSKPTEDVLVFSGTPTGVFANMKISDNKTITFTTPVGEVASEFKVKAKSGTHTLLSDAKYDIYALSSIQSSGKSAQMNNTYSISKGQALKTFGSAYSGESSFKFSIKDNPFGIIPAITIYGAVSIGKPSITVTKISDGTVFGEDETPELDPREKINVKVTIPKSQIATNFSAVYKYSGNYLKYGWKLDKDGSITTRKEGGDCEIGITADDAIDTLNIKNASGVFKNRTFSGNTINWSNITASEASTLEVEAITNDRKIYPDAHYRLYSLSKLGNTKDSSTTKVELDKNTSIGKINGAKSSSIFNFKLLEEVWIKMPTIVRTGGALTFGNPTITVKKSSDKSIVKSGTTLDPSDKLDIVITLPQSSVSGASYSVDVSKLTYGWKLIQNGEEILGKPTDQCNIGLTVDKTSDDTHTITGSGAFSGLSKTTLTKNGVSVGERGKLTISSTSGIYTIKPKYSDCKIYSVSSYGNTNDSYSAIPPSNTINRTTKTATFEYFVKAAQKELFYKIVQPANMQTLLQSASSYNPLTENNLINDLGFTKYTKDNTGVTIGGGYCVILSKLTESDILVLDAKQLPAKLTVMASKPTINGYNLYYMAIGGSSTYTLKIN